jgi:hypothetical protein
MLPSRRRTRVQTVIIVTIVLFLVYSALDVISGDAQLQSIRYGTPARQNSPLAEEKELVVASIGGDDISWLDDFFSDWKKNIYVVNNASAPLTVPKNKGREAMPFLTYSTT